MTRERTKSDDWLDGIMADLRVTTVGEIQDRLRCLERERKALLHLMNAVRWLRKDGEK